MSLKYTDEKNAQIVVALLKKHNIKKIVVSPGATNIPFAQSVQYDSFFEVYSVVDERSAAYVACGLDSTSGEPVVLSCTGATASRNYLSGLTEAYYRKLPIIAITSFSGNYNIGNLVAQSIDRTVVQNDVVKLSIQLPIVKDSDDEWYTNLHVNKAILESIRNGGGPVHINLPTSYLGTFNTESLPEVRIIKRYKSISQFPKLEKNKKIVIFLGAHRDFTISEQEAIDNFCLTNQVVVLCDHTSGYHGKYRLQSSLACANGRKGKEVYKELKPDIIFHLGEISGDYSTLGFLEESGVPVWRISEDGEVRDKFKTLEKVFECSVETFFNTFKNQGDSTNQYFKFWEEYDNSLRQRIPTLPFSNLWIANQMSTRWPGNSEIHLGILNALRCNNFFNINSEIKTMSNVGGFGIDGTLSSLIGASYFNKNKNYLAYVGDLAFFYDMNSLGIRDVGPNVKIIVINNNGGAEFKLYSHVGSALGDGADNFVAARNHYDQSDKQNQVIQKWSEAVGFDYFKAIDQQSFETVIAEFLSDNDKPSILECVTTIEDDSKAIECIEHIDQSFTNVNRMKNTIKAVMPKDLKKGIKKVLKK